MSLVRVLTRLTATLLLLVAIPVSAQQYRWLDERGRVQYTDTPPPPTAKGVQKKNLKGSVVETPVPYELDRAMKGYPVSLFTAPSCGDSCDNARAALNARGVPFREIQVGDEPSRAELQKFTKGNEVPVIVVGKQVHTGFQPATYERMLDDAGYPKTGSIPPRKQVAPPLPPDKKPAPATPPAEPAAKQ